jgi:hypothetical protein
VNHARERQGRLLENFQTYFRLGIRSVLSVIVYRLLIRFRMHPVQYIRHRSFVDESNFFNIPAKVSEEKLITSFSLEEIKNGYFPFSGKYVEFNSNNPNWHKNYFENTLSKKSNIDWWSISDFDSDLGDIKNVWELSRFDWVIQLAAIGKSGNIEALEILNSRLANWVEMNPPYKGVNWKCGQEASIRLLHLVYALIILGQHDRPENQIVSLIEMHVKRIAPTLSYAIAQNNNHGTSEAAALFIGGHFLYSKGLRKYKKLSKKGEFWLTNRAVKLFSEDGCFSQYSVNYHRFALDTYSFCEIYRRLNKLDCFSAELIMRIKKATQWLEVLTNPKDGDTPNVGANDGALLFPIFDNNFRDFRHCVQLANLVFYNRLIYDVTPEKSILYVQLGLMSRNATFENPISEKIIFGNHDGFCIYKKDDVLILFRRPIFKFRPSHEDVLHVDLWFKGERIFIDAGSFSYFTKNEKYQYYTGPNSHNTIVFDGRNQMNRISNFLFGSWIKEEAFNCIKNSIGFEFSSSYRLSNGIIHERTISIGKNIVIKDRIDGNFDTAILNWRVQPNFWKYMEKVNSDELFFDYKSKILFGNFTVNGCMESRIYNDEDQVDCIKVKINNSKTIITKFNQY